MGEEYVKLYFHWLCLSSKTVHFLHFNCKWYHNYKLVLQIYSHCFELIFCIIKHNNQMRLLVENVINNKHKICFKMLNCNLSTFIQIFFTTWNELFLLHLLFIIFNTVFWISFVKTHITDPGFLAKEDEKYAWTMENVNLVNPHISSKCFDNNRAAYITSH